jgi:hypothetical protein
LLLNNFVVLLESGGTISMPCNLQGMSSHGMNSGSPFEHIIFPQDYWSENLMSSWLLLKVPIQFCSTHRISIICASMRDIMQIMMPRNKIVFVEALIPSSRNA